MALVGGIIVITPGAIFPIAALVKLLNEAQYAPRPVHIPEESNPEKVRNSIYYMKKYEYIKIKQVGKKRFKFELTKKGKKLLTKYSFSDFRIKPAGLWDGHWRMFIFDIPEKKKLLRDSLREKLKSIGFFRFQKSVWVYPFECEKEMRYICEFLDIQPYTVMFTGKIHNDLLLRKHFCLKGILSRREICRV